MSELYVRLSNSKTLNSFKTNVYQVDSYSVLPIKRYQYISNVRFTLHNNTFSPLMVNKKL